MAILRKQLSLGAKSFLLAAAVSLLGVVAWNAHECQSRWASCILETPAFWAYWAPSLLIAWIIAAVALRTVASEAEARSMTKVCELWWSESENSYAFFPAENSSARALLPSDATLHWTVEASSWKDACSKKQAFLGWEPYVPEALAKDGW